jgi:hypothetical protein
MDSRILEENREAVEVVVREMAGSMSGEQSTRHWTNDTVWFDIPAFASGTGK